MKKIRSIGSSSSTSSSQSSSTTKATTSTSGGGGNPPISRQRNDGGSASSSFKDSSSSLIPLPKTPIIIMSVAASSPPTRAAPPPDDSASVSSSQSHTATAAHNNVNSSLFSRASPFLASITKGNKISTKEHLKEHIKQRNVRRKSSTMNTSCFSYGNGCNTYMPSPDNTTISINDNFGAATAAMALGGTNKNSSTFLSIDQNLIAKAAKRGSIHYSTTEQAHLTERLAKLQSSSNKGPWLNVPDQSDEMLNDDEDQSTLAAYNKRRSSSQRSSQALRRSFIDFNSRSSLDDVLDAQEEEDDDDAQLNEWARFSGKNLHRPSMKTRLSRAISSLSLIVTDDENNQNSGEGGSGNANKLNQTKVSLTNSLTDVNEDLINEKSNEIGRVTKWATGFERLLEDPIGLHIFTEFLKKEFSEENITFWVKCENFKKLSDPGEMRNESQNIWMTYLDTSSMHQINVDNKARSRCQEALQTPNNTMFEMAQTQIFSLMKYDSYSRFLKSQMYKECIVNEMEGKPIYSATNNPVNKSVAGVKGKVGGKLSSQVNVMNEAGVDVLVGGADVHPGANSSNAGSLSHLPPTLLASAAANNTALLSNNNSNSNISSTASSYSNSGGSGGGMQPPLSPLLNNSHLLNTPAASAAAGTPPSAPPNKEKKKSTILPWTKAFIKWKRLSGKDKKAIPEPAAPAPPPPLPPLPPPFSSVKQTNITLTKNLNDAIGHMSITQSGSAGGAGSDTTANAINSNLIKAQLNEYDLNEAILDTSATLSSHIESRYCRVLCNSDGSSTMIQAIPGQTVYQALSKIFVKKQIPCYKCDLYFVGDYQPINQQCDAHILGSKEICLVERSLFVLSLMPIAINLCVKANRKKSIITILQPILDCYQIKTNNCSIYLNSTGNLLNQNDRCSVVDNQHVVVVHKNQTSLLSAEEIEKFINVSVSDFIPVNINEFHFQFDELGILKQKITKTPVGSPTAIQSSQFQHFHQTLSPQSQQQQHQPHPDKILLKSLNEEQEV